MRAQARASFYSQLAQLTDAGLPPGRQLLLAAEASGPPYRDWGPVLQAQVEGGASVAAALEHCGESAAAVALVAAAEHSAQLPAICRRIADIAEQQDRLQRRILARSLYPLLLLHVALILPPAALAIAGGGSAAGALLVPLLLWGVALSLWVAWRSPALAAVRTGLLHAPPLDWLILPLRDAETCQVLGAGAAAGLLASEQLALAAAACPWPARAQVLTAQATVLRQGTGHDLTTALAASGMRRDLVDRIRVAEQAGTLAETCTLLAAERHQCFEERSAWAARLLTGAILGIAMLVAAVTILGMAGSLIPAI